MQQHSLIAVFEAIAASGEVSRASISEMTGFSLMTVGKAVDKLISCSIVTEKKTTGGGVGRKSGICALDKSRGMIIFDLTAKPYVRVVDIANNIIDERDGEDVGELMLWAMNTLFEADLTEIMGTAVITSREQIANTAHELEETLGVTPELTVEANRAAAYANARRFEYDGMALFLRVEACGKVDGALMQGGVPYIGAHGRAGDFDLLAITRNALADKIADICLVTDPALIHIACARDFEIAPIEGALREALSECGFTDSACADVIVEPAEFCRDAACGAALMLREKYVLSKIPNNA